MELIFVTGNEHKLAEVKGILSEHTVTGKKIELAEIQGSLNEIIEAKIAEAVAKIGQHVFVEDVGLYLDVFGGFPGPYIKDFLKHMPIERIWDIADLKGNKQATVKCAVGYGGPGLRPKILVAEVEGELHGPAGENGFGFDPIFVPKGFCKTYAQMTSEEKNKVSHRSKALTLLKEYLMDHAAR